MYLILGHPADLCCLAVASALREAGHAVQMMTSPFDHPAQLVMEIDRYGRAKGLRSGLRLDEGPIPDIEGVFVRSNGMLDAAGWDPGDHAYMQAETSAALLAWLAALDCPVINRPTAEIWYRHWTPLVYWMPRLRRAGLPVPDMTIASEAVEAQQFRLSLEADGVPGAICATLAREERWLVTSADWAGVAKLQRHAPVTLIEPHQDPNPACIVGDTVIWDEPAGPVTHGFEARMLRFAAELSLDFIEFAVAHVRQGWAVVDVNPLPRLEHFGQTAQARIVKRLVALAVSEPRAVEASE